VQGEEDARSEASEWKLRTWVRRMEAEELGAEGEEQPLLLRHALAMVTI